MKKKGFTLIELIAVLVILAILALIVTPLVLNIIRKAKISADKRSVDAYGRSIEISIAEYLLEEGKELTNIDELTVNYKGDIVSCDIKELNEDMTIYLSMCKVNNREVKDANTNDGYYHYGKKVYPNAVKYLIKKANDISVTSYTDGNINEMYTFSHAATEQTASLIDYRYIGNSPYNYITFNNESWRIVGIFEVEDENGNFAKKIKIMRNNYLDDYTLWDIQGGPAYWVTVSSNTYLNNEYFNSIDLEFQNMISSSKFYIGAMGNSGSWGIGDASRSYNEERSLNVVGNREVYWIGNIAYIYASDYLYTCALGIDNTCYNNRGKETENPTWIDVTSYPWLLNSDKDSGYRPYYIHANYKIHPSNNGTSVNEHKLVPALYLDPELVIISGTGKESEPYLLQIKK